jgi:hypothetical protein
MRRQKQIGFQLLEQNSIKTFGGSLLKKSNAKVARPISIKKSMHLVMRSSAAKGAFSLLKKDQEIYNVIDRQAKKHGVKVYNYANGGNHLHLIVRPVSRRAFNNFVRSISGLIARMVLNAQRGRAKLSLMAQTGVQKFWDQRPFTRIIEWGRDFDRSTKYLLQNTLEAYGFVAYKPRGLPSSSA